jgi:hypothetical protein
MSRRPTVAIAALVVVACACSRSREAADAATAHFRERFSAGQYATIYQDAAPEFRASITGPEFDKMMDGVSKKLGRFRSTTQRSWNVHFGTGGKTITLGFASEFEKASAVETFVWKSQGDAIVLQGYNINSRALVTY